MKKIKVLIVEDEQVVAKNIKHALNRLGYEVTDCVSSGEEVLNIFEQCEKQDCPRIVLMDIMLHGEMDGIETAKTLIALYDVAIIFLTAYSNDSVVERAKQVGVFGYILKPFHENELRITLEMAIYKQEMERKQRENSQLLSATLDSIGDGVIATDKHGNIIFMNSIAESITEWTNSTGIGKKLSEVFTFADNNRYSTAEQLEILRYSNRQILPAQLKLQTKSGKTVPIEGSASKIKNNDIGSYGEVFAFKDISDRKAAQDALLRSERHIRSLLNAIPDTILYLDSKGTLIDYRIGEGNEIISDYEDIIGKNIREILPETIANQTIEAIHTSIRERKTIPYEFELQLPTGHYHHEARIAYSSESSVVMIVRDITQSVETTRELFIRNRAIDESLTGIMIADAQQKDCPIIYANPAAERITGYTADEIKGKNCRFLQNDDIHQESAKLIREAIVTGREISTVIRNYRKDGTLFWNEVSISPVRNQSGILTHFIGMQNDVTERITAKKNLQESEERFRTIINDLPIPIILHIDTILYSNIAALRFLGAEDKSQVIGVNPLAYLFPDSAELVKQRVGQMVTTGKALPPAIVKITNLLGEYKEVEVASVPIIQNNQTVILTIINDITDKRNAEKALRDSEYKYRSVLQSLNEGIVLTDLDDTIIHASNKVAEIIGNSLDDIIGKKAFAVILKQKESSQEYLQRIERRKNGVSEHYQINISEDDATEQWLEVSAAPYRNADGDIIGTVGAISDITERIQANAALEQSKQKYKNLVKNAPIGIVRWIINEQRYEFANKEFERQIGFSIEEFSKLSFEETAAIFHPDDREKALTVSKEWMQNGAKDVLKTQYRSILKNGEEQWTEVYCFAEHNKTTELPETITQISVDITELKQTEIVLSNAQQEDFRRTVMNLQNLVVKMYRREDGEYAYSLREGKLAGEYTTKLVQGQTPKYLFGKEYETRVLPHLHKVFAGESVSFEAEIPGNKYYFFTLEPLFENDVVVEIVGSAVDISLQKEAERKLQESENKFRVLADSLPLSISQVSNYQGHLNQLDYVNMEFTKQTGYAFEEWKEITSGTSQDFIHPDDRERVKEESIEWAKNGMRANFQISYRFIHKEGHYIWLENHATKFTKPDGQTVIVQAAINITDRKESEQRLHHLASFPEQIPQPIIEISREGEITYLNPEALRCFPNIKSEYLENPVLAGLYEQLDDLRSNPYTSSIREVIANSNIFEERVFFIPETQTIRVFLYDITERKRSEEELERTITKERELNALKTQFITTVSHEFRTPLTGIQISSDLLAAHATKMDFGQRISEIDKIKARVQDLTELMNDFLMQSSVQSLKDKFIPIRVNLDEICDRVHSELHGILHTKSQTLKLTIPKDLPNIIADSRMIKQIITNLITNASKYSPMHKNIILIIRQEEQGNILIQVADSGIGIAEEEMKNLFTPFFRGSNVGTMPGTGLGLSIVKEMVEFHGGTVEAKSKIGVGSVFTVHLPTIPQVKTLP
jgi:PAS domain S-box-containing protein